MRSTCDESGEYIVTNATFEVQAQRRDNRGAREVVLPYFATVVQGDSNVVAKRVSRVGLRFADGQYRASTTGAATSQVLRSAATLPEDIRRQITRERRPAIPTRRSTRWPIRPSAPRSTRARFEVLVGFELTQEQLALQRRRAKSRLTRDSGGLTRVQSAAPSSAASTAP